ncbi:MAG TPA: hypothetical protein VGY98_11885 [Verrucomicrobiae bacterium]|nr:hypothetical protein [Verrucomicrobiae bacterium]
MKTTLRKLGREYSAPAGFVHIRASGERTENACTVSYTSEFDPRANLELTWPAESACASLSEAGASCYETARVGPFRMVKDVQGLTLENESYSFRNWNYLSDR